MKKTASERFRAAVEASLDLETADPVWVALLDQCCSILDRVEALEARIEQDGLTVEGSKGQPVVNPLVPEVRQHQLAAARLLERLGLSEDETQSDRQRKIANRRWHP